MDTQPAPQKTTSFSHQAAKLSWVCPIAMWGISIFSHGIGSPVVKDLLALVLILVGLIFGIVALFGIPKQGMKGIVAPALVGIIINGLLLSIFVTNFMAARARAMQQNSSTTEASPMIAPADAATNAVYKTGFAEGRKHAIERPATSLMLFPDDYTNWSAATQKLYVSGYLAGLNSVK